MTESDVMAIERLLSDFAWHADRGNGPAMAELFSSAATLCVGGAELSGRQAITDDCCRRASEPNRKVRHVWSNLRIGEQIGDTVTATAIQMTFEQTGADEPTQLRVNDLFDTFVKNEQGIWRFVHRTIKREMALSL